MKRISRNIIAIIIFLSILFGINLKSYAENNIIKENITATPVETNTNSENKTTENNTNDNNISTNKTISDSRDTTTTTIKKSSNANLKNLGIRPHDFSGFKPTTTKYNVTVPEETTSIEVYAQSQDSKAKVSGTGTIKLQKEEESVDVVVTAEDGTTKTYTINIVKSDVKNENNSNEYENSDKGLASLQINDLNLNPNFDTNIYEYSVKYIGEESKLDIQTNPTDESYIVEVVGNNELKEGENIITILVSENNGDNVATYQITVNKSLVDEEAIAKQNAEKKEKQKKIIIYSAIGIVILATIIFIIIKRRNSKDYDNEYSEVPFYGINNEEEENKNVENYKYDVPKALNKQYEEDDSEELTKEEAKKEFLNEYNSKKIEEATKKRIKGKRFK